MQARADGLGSQPVLGPNLGDPRTRRIEPGPDRRSNESEEPPGA